MYHYDKSTFKYELQKEKVGEKLKIRKNKSIYFIELVIFIVFIINYYIIQKKFNYGYMKFHFEISIYKMIVVFIFYFSISFFSKFIKNNFVFAVWHILFQYMYLPTLIYYMFNENSIKPVISLTIVLYLIIFFSNLRFTKLLSIGHYNDRFLYKILLFASILMLIPFIYVFRNNVDINNLLLINIYERRLMIREGGNVFTAYLQSPLVRVIFPVLFIYALNNKKKLITLYSIAGIIYIFLCTTAKSNLLLLFVVAVFYIGDDALDKIKLFSIGVLGVSIFSILEPIIFKSIYLIDFIIRRVFFIPPMLDNVFYEHFEKTPLLWSYTRLGDLINNDSEFGREVIRYIGEVVLNVPNLRPNVGIITEAFISANFLGVVLYSLLIVLFIIYFKSIDFDLKYFGIFIIYIYFFNTAFLETLLLSHGLLAFILISHLYLRKYNVNGARKKLTGDK